MATTITTSRTADGACQVSAAPAGTKYVKVARCAKASGGSGAEIEYPWPPLAFPLTAPVRGTSSHPWVSLQATDANYAAIGGWSEPRVQTLPAPPPPPASTMIKGLDAGGWCWDSALADIAGCVKNIRSSAFAYYDTDAQVALLAAHKLKLSPLFNAGNSLGGIDVAHYSNSVVQWFKTYGAQAQADEAELLNEPNNPYFWSDPENLTAYVKVVKATKAALVNAGLGKVKVLVSWDGGWKGDDYGRKLLGLGLRPGQDFDGPTVHPYGGHTSAAESALGNRKRVTEAHADTGLPVYVTEVGWPTAVGMAATGDSLQWTEAQQAANIKTFIDWARGLGYVARVVSFNYADYQPNNYYGVVDTTGKRHKQSYAALAAA